jgi:hypothetical protein
LVSVYAAVAALCVFVGLRERHEKHADDIDLLPSFWFVSAALLAFMAFARATDLGDTITEIGRNEVRDEGWYETRRSIQAFVVGAIGLCWAVLVVVGIWRVPERRRRYLPSAVALFTLVCFTAARVISLHQVDTVLYRREIAGARAGVVLELVLVAVLLACTVARINVRSRHDRARSSLAPRHSALGNNH